MVVTNNNNPPRCKRETMILYQNTGILSVSDTRGMNLYHYQIYRENRVYWLILLKLSLKKRPFHKVEPVHTLTVTAYTWLVSNTTQLYTKSETCATFGLCPHDVEYIFLSATSNETGKPLDAPDVTKILFHAIKYTIRPLISIGSSESKSHPQKRPFHSISKSFREDYIPC